MPDQSAEEKAFAQLDATLREMIEHTQNMVVASWDLPSPLPPDLQQRARRCWQGATSTVTRTAELGDLPTDTLALLHRLADRADRVRELFA